jgi:hypothetical protein
MPRIASLGVLLLMGMAASAQDLPLVEDVEPAPLREHGRRLLQALEALPTPLPAETIRALRALLQEREEKDLAEKVQRLLDPFCLAAVTINPESRVKAARGPAAAELRRQRATVFLIKIHNDAGVSHALAITGPQLRAGTQAEEGQWLEVVVHAQPPLGKTLSGRKLEYVVVRLTPHETGKREATLKFDVGQGTQDLGFRAELPVLFRIRE